MQDKHVRENQSVAGARFERQNARPTIGVLISHPTHKNDYSMWLGVVDAAQKRDVNVICFVGLNLHSPHGFEAQANVIYDLVSAEKLDGLVIMAGAIAQFVRPEEKRAFIERYRPLPIVTLEGHLAGFPNIYVDSFQNMRKAVLHLIQAHNYRRIAFIRGPENQREANERYRAYVETLAEYGLPLDPALVTPSLKWQDGKQGLSWLLDHHVDFEAVIGANDDLAMGAIEELRARGIQVPEKVAVVGYDDAAQSRWITPPLTTVPIETYKWGQQALEMVLALIEGKPVPEQVAIPTELVIRQSCGCINPAVVQATLEPAAFLPEGSNERMSLETAMLGKQEDVLAEIKQTVGEQVLIVPGQITQLWDAFIAELNNMSSGVFLQTLDQILHQTLATSGEMEGWDRVVSVLRRQALPCLRDSEELLRAENLWQQGRVLIGKTAQRMQGYRQVLSEQRMSVLREIGAELVTTFDTQSLMDVLARQLPRLDIPSAYLALYEDPKQPTKQAKLLLAYNEQGRIEIQAEGQVFPSLQLVPAGSLPQGRPYSLIAEPLYFHKDQLGFALFEMGPQDGSVYEALRSEISSALHGATLVQQVERRALQLQTAAQVSRATSSILDLDELLSQTVELIRDRFGLYYAGLFLVDQTGEGTGGPGEWAVLRAGTGKEGQKMLAAGHKLEVGGSSMVGWCIANRQARIALDVGEEAVRFSNPLLPRTRSELALPLVSRGQVIGAMTAQSDLSAAFTQEDITTLQSMADQLANAIENARLFTEHQQSEEVLASERNLLRSLIDNIPDRIYAKDTESRFIICNLALVRRMGKTSPDELVGKSDFDLVPRELAERFYADEQAVIRSGQPLLNHEEPLETVGGKTTRWNLATKVPLRDSQGNIIGIVGLGREITDLKQSQLKLERNALQLRTAAEISRAASSLLTLDELLPQVVELIHDRFDLYYVGLFLVDETGQHAVLQAGTGEARQKMLEAHHQVEVGGASMVGWCIANRQARIALDVGQDAVRLANRLLPETRSEMALPLISRGRAIGALTIQSSQEAAFTEEDTIILQTMAGQVANAIENARLLAERKQAETKTQETLQEMERLYRATSGEGWQAFRQATDLPTGYLFDRRSIQPAEDVWVPQIEQAVKQNTLVPPTPFPGTTGEGQHEVGNVAVAPLSVRGQVIGVVGVYDDSQRPLSPDELALVQEIADQGALALESARLFEQTQTSLSEARTRAEELAALNELAQTLSTRLDMDQVLQETYQGLSRLMDTTNFYIALYDPEKNEVSFPINVSESVLDQQITVLPADQGMTGHIIRNRTSVLIKDHVTEWHKRMGMETVGEIALSWLGVPLIIGDQILGVMALQSYTTPGLYDEHDRDLLSAFANQTAIAIQNARLFEQTRAALAEVEATHRRYLREQWGTFLAGAAGQTLGYVDGPAGLLPARDESLATAPASATGGLAVPIRLRGEPIGVLEFSDKDATHTWSEDERDLVEALADQAALALENARLFEETQSRARTAQLINEITARVRTSTNIETILRTTAEELAKTLNLPRARIRLGSGSSDSNQPVIK